MLITNMESEKGNPVANQFVITLSCGVIIFKSYESIIVIKNKGHIFLNRCKWDYSRTTIKYTHRFLGYGSRQIRRMITYGPILTLSDKEMMDYFNKLLKESYHGE